MGRSRKSRVSSSESASTSSSSTSSDTSSSEDSREERISRKKHRTRQHKKNNRSKTKHRQRSNQRRGRKRKAVSRSLSPVRRKTYRRIVDSESESGTADILIQDDILNILGPEQEKEEWAAPIQKDIALQWELLLKQGVKAEDRQKIMEKYKIPKNCPSCAPPKLNLEVKAAINETVLKRDQRLEKVQTWMGTSLAALGKALSLLISEESEMVQEGERNLEIIEALSESETIG